MIGCLDEMDQISRRRFLQISAATFGAAAATIPLRSSWAAAEALAAKDGELKVIPTTCDMCFWKCGALAYVRDGKLWKIEGNPLDPLSRGRLCTRGTGGIGACEDPDRLRTPLLRVGERGREEWKSVTWGEALDFTAKRMKEIAAVHGPESIAMFKHGIGAYFVEHALKAFGTPNIAAPSFAQCRGPRDVGYTLTVGLTPGSPETLDIAHTRCLVLLGSHIGENMHNTQVQEFAEAIRNGATIIVADPRFSTAASKAKYWLPLRAGTDLALLLAWMNVIVSEGLYDKKFVAEHGEGFEAFAKALAPSTPQWAAKETGLDAKVIVATAREMAKHRPATLIHPGRRSSWYGDDTQRSRANALLNALMGNFGHKGGFYVPSYTELPDYPGVPKYPKSARGKADNPGKRWPFADQTVTTGLREATITGKPYPIKGWVVDGTNLLQAMPDRKRTLEAIAALDLLVVVDTVPSEIAGYADVVLPEAMYLERYDTLNEDCLRVPFIALRQPVVEPPHEQKPGWWIGRELGIRLGLESYFPWKDAEQCLRTRLEKGGYDWARAQGQGRDRGREEAAFHRGRRRDHVRDAIGEGGVLVEAARRQGLRCGAEVHAPRSRPQGRLSPDHRARADAHLQPHHRQPAARRAHARQRGVDQRGPGEEAGPEERRERAPQEPGWRAERAGEAARHRAHPSRVRVPGARFRQRVEGLEGRLAQGRLHRAAHDQRSHRPAHGRDQHPHQLRDARESRLRKPSWPASEW